MVYSAVFQSNQLGNSPTIGYVLQTNGATSTWVSTSSLGITSSGSGITSLNSQTGSTQTFASSTLGTDFSITSSSNVHTFTLPSASASARGLLTSTDWSTFNNKVSNAYASSTFASTSWVVSTFVPYSYASSTFASTSWITSTFPSFSYASSAYYLATNPSNFITSAIASSTYASTSWVTATFAPKTSPTFTGTVNLGSQASSTGLTADSFWSTLARITNASTTGITATNIYAATSTFNAIINHVITADASDGLLIEAANGTDVASFGTGNTANTTLFGSLALNANNITMTGNLASIGSRVANAFLTTLDTTNASSTNATTTNLTLRGLSSSFLAVDANGRVIATTSPTGGTFSSSSAMTIGTLYSTSTLNVLGTLRDSTNASGTNGQVLQSTGSGVQWVTNAAAGVSGTGSNGLLSLWNSTSNLVTSLFMDNGTVTGVGATSSTERFTVRGSGTLNPFNVASSSGSSLFFVASNGRVGIGTTTFDSTNPEELKVVSDNNTVTGLSIFGNINNYFQTKIKNLSSGSSASTDFVAEQDTGNEFTGFANMGINNSGYTAGIVGSANDSYFYGSSTGNVLYGSATTNKDVVFFTGGTNAYANERMRITSTGNIGIGTSTPVALLTVQGTSSAPIASLFTISTSTGATMFSFGSNGRLFIATSTYLTNATTTNEELYRGGVNLFAQDLAAKSILASKIASSSVNYMQGALWQGYKGWWYPSPVATGQAFSLVMTASSTGVATTTTYGTQYQTLKRIVWSTVATNVNQQVGIKSDFFAVRSATTTYGGFFYAVKFGFDNWTSGNTALIGLTTCANNCATPVGLPTLINTIGFAVVPGTNSIVFQTNDASGAAATTTLGAPTLAPLQAYNGYMYNPAGTNVVYYQLENALTGAVIATGQVTTDLPPVNNRMAHISHCSNGSNAAVNACQISLMNLYIETDK